MGFNAVRRLVWALYIAWAQNDHLVTLLRRIKAVGLGEMASGWV